MNILLLLILLFSDIFAFLIYLDKHTVCVWLCVYVCACVCVLGARVRASVCMRVYLRVFACVCVRVLVCTCLVSRVSCIYFDSYRTSDGPLAAWGVFYCLVSIYDEAYSNRDMHAHACACTSFAYAPPMASKCSIPFEQSTYTHTYVVCVYIIYIYRA